MIFTVCLHLRLNSGGEANSDSEIVSGYIGYMHRMDNSLDIFILLVQVLLSGFCAVSVFLLQGSDTVERT